MTPRLLPRSRPRQKSVDFSRLWWLLANEAAFQIRLRYGRPQPIRHRYWFHGHLFSERMGLLRSQARRALQRWEVIL